jgi:hypothetical protein
MHFGSSRRVSLLMTRLGRKSLIGLGPLVCGFRTLGRSVSDFSFVPIVLQKSAEWVGGAIFAPPWPAV